MKHSSTQYLARAAMFSALGASLLFLGSVLPTLRLVILCSAAFCVAYVRMSCPRPWGWLCYGAAGALSLLLPDKTMGILFLAFFGYYPLLFLELERIASPALRWGLKLVGFNLAAAALYAAASGLLGRLLPRFAASPVLLFAAANAGFLCFDYALRQMILYYLRHISGKV